MKFWFVSRERFEDERKRCAKLEAEIERLHELLIPGLRAPTPEPAVETLQIGENTDLSKIVPIQGKPTIAFIMGKANQAAALAAQIPGAKGIARELAERARPAVAAAPAPPKAVNGD